MKTEHRKKSKRERDSDEKKADRMGKKIESIMFGISMAETMREIKRLSIS